MQKLFILFTTIFFFTAKTNAQLFQNVIGKVTDSESALSITQSVDSSYFRLHRVT